jgi:hypothetical protein
MGKNSRSLLWYLLVLILFLIFRHIYMFGTHYGFDDMHYARLAHDISLGRPLDPDDHYTFRWMFIWPIAICYYLGGINDLTSVIWSWISILITATVMFVSYSEKASLRLKFALGFLLISTPWIGHYSDKIMPDVPAMMAVMVTVYGLYRYLFNIGSTSQASVIYVSGWIAGFLIKESIIIIFPAFILILCIDLLQKRKVHRFWWQSAGLLILGTIIYLGVCYHFFGHPFARAHSIYANGYLSDCSYDQLPIEATWKRIFIELWRRMLDGSMFLSLPMLVLAFSTQEQKAKFWALVSILFFMCADFMTTSFTHYVPLCPDVRHFLWCVPPGLIAMSHVIPTNPNKLPWIIACILGVLLTVVSYMISSESWPIYILSLITLVSIKFSFKNLYIFVFLIALCLTFQSYIQSQPYNYHTQKLIINKYFKEPKAHKQIVISNSAEINMDRYISAFDTTKCIFIKQQDIDPATLDSNADCYFILNGMTAYLSGIGWGDYPSWIRDNLGDFEKIDSMDNIILYKVDRKFIK